MIKYLLVLSLFFLCSCAPATTSNMASSENDWFKQQIKRHVDYEYGVVCYSTGHSNLQCVKVD